VDGSGTKMKNADWPMFSAGVPLVQLAAAKVDV
jgi:hypothetical protein